MGVLTSHIGSSDIVEKAYMQYGERNVALGFLFTFGHVIGRRSGKILFGGDV
jgi:high-affinity nickel permease